MEKPLRPMFGRVGSKRRMAQYIISLIPSDIETYIEPFIGGGAIYWMKSPSQREVINDLDSSLMEGYELIKTVSPTSTFRKDLTTVVKAQLFMDTPAETDADRLTQIINQSCNTFGNKWVGKQYYSHNPYSKLKHITKYQQRIKNTIILNKSYEDVLTEYDSSTSFFYLDPPYTKGSRKGTLYKHDIDTFSYELLFKRLVNIKGKWLLSMLDTPEIRHIFNGYYFKTIHLGTHGGSAVGSKPRQEILIANYQI